MRREGGSGIKSRLDHALTSSCRDSPDLRITASLILRAILLAMIAQKKLLRLNQSQTHELESAGYLIYGKPGILSRCAPSIQVPVDRLMFSPLIEAWRRLRSRCSANVILLAERPNLFHRVRMSDFTWK